MSKEFKMFKNEIKDKDKDKPLWFIFFVNF
jgi:hypothetical protein